MKIQLARKTGKDLGIRTCPSTESNPSYNVSIMPHLSEIELIQRENIVTRWKGKDKRHVITLLCYNVIDSLLNVLGKLKRDYRTTV